MWTTSTVFLKTDKGHEALATRGPGGLPPRLRTALIMVDGRLSVSELTATFATLGDPQQLLQALEAGGLIAPGATAQPAAPPAAAPAPHVAPATDAPTPQARRQAVRALTDLMGPTAEPLCIALEEARTPQQWAGALRRCEAALREFGGADMAARFAATVAQAPT